jgi:hypothetical protein
MRFLAIALIAAPLVAPFALAGEDAPGEPILVDEWRAMTAGRTVWYSLNGEHWGKEHFHPSKDQATFVGADGECVTAEWIYADGVYCFAYGGLHCFRHLRRGGEIVIAPLGDGAVQTVEQIDRTPLSCEPPAMS